ncbi:hypothetical protein ACFLZP_03800 [Patescibacteria group bacterium]
MTNSQNQPVTRDYLDKTLDKKFSQFTAELSKFLEEKVIEPLFGLKKDVKTLKKDVSSLQSGLDRIERKVDTALEKTVDHDRQLADHEDRLQTIKQAKFARVGLWPFIFLYF